MHLSSLSTRLRALLPQFASQCAVCRSWPAEQVCAACVARFLTPLPRCQGCAQTLHIGASMPGAGTLPLLCPDCMKTHPPVNACLVAADYAYPWSSLITRFKFGDHPGWATFFADILLAVPAIGHAVGSMRQGDLILPVPLSRERLQQRGFNQAWELASALAARSNSAARPDARLLLRVRHTRPQTELRRHERVANVAGAFQLDPLRASLIAGSRVILVDDVMTSGASLFSAASALRVAGASHITAVAVARTAMA